MHPDIFICIRHASVCTHMPPYASITHPNANISTHIFAEKVKSQTNSKSHKIIIAIGSVKLLWIQPNIPNLLKNGKTPKK